MNAIKTPDAVLDILHRSVKKQPTIMAGVDEAGRGCLAGPVVAAAVVLPASMHIGLELKDSKQLSAPARERLEKQIKASVPAWSLGLAWPNEIDRVNILQATLQAMCRAVSTLKIKPKLILVDGNQPPPLSVPCQCIPGGDKTVAAISAASIVAKVFRDRLMGHLDRKYPGYGFERHKGYGTKGHLQQLDTLGPCTIHRRSFAPVRRVLKERQQWLPGI